MLETVAMRALAVLSLMLSFMVGSAALRGSGSWRQTLAELVLSALLFALAGRAWRRPLGGAERVRRRILRLAAVLVSPRLREEWAESTPGTDVDEALMADLRAALATDQEVLAAAFRADELEHVAALRDALERGAVREARDRAQAIQDAALRHASAGPAGVGVG